VGFVWERKIVDRTKLLLAGIVVIAAAGAFVYFDPMDLDLLGLKKSAVVAQAATPPRAPAPKAQPPAPAPKAAVAPAPKPPVPKPAAPNPAAPKPIAAAVAAMPVATKPAVALARTPLPPLKSSKTAKTAGKPAIDKPMRPKNQDLRHCLELETDAAIAKCAGE
jgi:outer membrane biosynthesis protein TonB